MKVVIAPDSYKESMSAMEAAACIREGLKKVFPDAECSLVPMADGGEGTARCLMLSQQGNKISGTVSGPLGKKTETDFVWIEKNQTAVIEVARACGMLMALGGRLLDREGKPVSLGAGGLSQIETVDLTEPVRLLKDVKITVLCDVKNRLLGKEGATYIFGPQKGVTEESLERIEAGMEHYAEKITGAVGRDVASMKGAGAAGGIGFALFAVSDARFCSGADYVMEALCLEEKIKNCDFVITGEGSIDAQSLQGKVPVRVARIAQKYKKPVYVFAGRQKGSMERFYEAGITAVFSILRSLKSMEEVLEEAPENLRCTVENFARVLAAGQIKVED